MPILKRKDFADINGILQDLDKIKKAISNTNEELKELQKLTRQVNATGTGSEAKQRIELTQKLNKGVNQLSILQKERLKTENQLKTVLAKNLQTQEKNALTLAKGKVRLQENNKLLKEQAKEALGLVGAYEKLAKQTNEAQKKFKNLATQFGVNSKEAKAARKEFERLDNKLSRVNKASRDGRKDVGRYGLALKGIGSQLLGSLGVVAGLSSLFNVIKGGFKVFVQFSKSSSRLAAILGTNKDGIKALTEQAKQLGATTAFTASEVISLQTELAKLGFSQTQIESSTEGILALAAATGSELAESAELAGATLRIFNLDASEMSRVSDVLAKSTTISSLSMEKLATILPIVGKTAQIAGVSLERTAALAGTLTDRGIDASSAATSLRNIFIELSAKGLTWEEAMTKINTSTDKTKTAVQLFGKRAGAAAVVLAETGDTVNDLTGQLNDASGAAQKMADVMLDNLAGDVTKAQSAWEGFILSLEDGQGVFSKVSRFFVQGFSNLLEQIKIINDETFELTSLQKQQIAFNARINDTWSKMTRTLMSLSTEEGKRHEALLLTNALFPKLEKAQEDFNKAQEEGAGRGTLTALKTRIQIYEELLKRLRPFVRVQNKSNEELENENDLLGENNDKRSKRVDNLRDEERLLRDITQGEIDLLEQGRRRAIIQAEEDRKQRLKEIENAKASKATKDAAIELLERQHKKRMDDINKEFPSLETVSLQGGKTTDQFKELQKGIDKQNEIINEGRKKDAQNLAEWEQAKLQIREEAQQAFVSFASDLGNTFIDERLQRELDAAEAEKSILQDKLDKNEISEAEFNKEISRINKRQREAEAKAEKRKALFDIAVATAVAVAKAGFITPAAFAAAAAGAIQAGLVAARPIPAFAEGTEFVDRGDNPKGRDTIPAMLDEGERVMTASQNKRLKGISNDNIVDIVENSLNPNKDFKSLTKTQSDSLLASLLMQGNKQNSQMILALQNLFGSYEKDGIITLGYGSGDIKKIIK